MDAWMDGWWMDDYPYYATGWILNHHFGISGCSGEHLQSGPHFVIRVMAPWASMGERMKITLKVLQWKPWRWQIHMATLCQGLLAMAMVSICKMKIISWEESQISGLRGAIIKSPRRRRIGQSLPVQTPTLQRLNIEGLEKTSSIITCQSSLVRDYPKWECAHPVPTWGDWYVDLAHWGYGEMWAHYGQILRFF